MIVHLALAGVSEGSLGVGIDVVTSATRLVDAGLAPAPPDPDTLRQRVVSIDGKPVKTGTRRMVQVEGRFSLRGLGPGDVVVVPGLFATTDVALDATLARADVTRAVALLRGAVARGVVLAASCSATFVLAASGALEGRRATTTWWLAPSFARRHPDVTLGAEQMVVEDGAVVTAGSAFAHADLMLAIVARVASAKLAHLVARYLVLDERPSQARYVVTEHVRATDPTIGAVERFVLANVERQLSLGELARAAGLSPRTLARRVHAGLGITPIDLVQRTRVHHAARLLETTGASVEEVAGRVGYADAAAFRRVYRRHLGESPRGARSRKLGSRIRSRPPPRRRR